MTVEANVEKSNRVLIVEQGLQQISYGVVLAYAIRRRLFERLDAPLERFVGAEVPPSVSRVPETTALANTDSVRAALVPITSDGHGAR